MAQPKISVDLILSKLAEEAEKAGESIQKASEVLLEPLETEIAVTPYDVVYEEDRVKLKHYKPTVEIQLKKPLLVVYALINRETMLDLQPGRSVVQNFLQEGIDVYMIDWGYLKAEVPLVVVSRPNGISSLWPLTSYPTKCLIYLHIIRKVKDCPLYMVTNLQNNEQFLLSPFFLIQFMISE